MRLHLRGSRNMYHLWLGRRNVVNIVVVDIVLLAF
jgi:hypothetical protein